jgi:hypothetical protein
VPRPHGMRDEELLAWAAGVIGSVISQETPS